MVRDKDLRYAIYSKYNVTLCPIRVQSIILLIQSYWKFYPTNTCNHLILYLISTRVRTALLSDQVSLCFGLKCKEEEKIKMVKWHTSKAF